MGNKLDLHVERCVAHADGKELADYMNAAFFEVRLVCLAQSHTVTVLCSAKENANVNQLFQNMLTSIEGRDRGVTDIQQAEVAEDATPMTNIPPATTNRNTPVSQANTKKDKCVIS